MNQSDQASELLERWLWSPEAFCYDVFGFELWEGQIAICDALRHHDQWAVRSGHKTGKSRLIASLGIWWAVTRPGGRAFLSSSSFFQVRKILWREVTLLYKQAKIDLGGRLYEDPRAGLVWNHGSEVVGFSTAEKERAAGISSPFNFYQIDEASGPSYDDLHDAIIGNLAGGGKIGLYSQATRTTGVFYNAFRDPRSKFEKITLNSETTPNVKAGRVIVPGLATKEWVEERREEWGQDSTLYAVRVTGDFPKQGDQAIVTYNMLHISQMTWRARKIAADMSILGEMDMIRNERGPMYIGVDVSYFGNDDCVVMPRRGLTTMQPKKFSKIDGVTLAGEVLDFCDDVRRSGVLGTDKIIVNVDIVGMGGTSCYDHLVRSRRAKLLGVVVFKINTSEEPDDPSVYKDMKTEMMFIAKKWFMDGGAVAEEMLLEQELLLPEYDYDENLKKMLVFTQKEGVKPRLTKQKERALLGRSPDVKDSFLLSLYDNTSRMFKFVSSQDDRMTSLGGMNNYLSHHDQQESGLSTGVRSGSGYLGKMGGMRNSLKNYSR